MMKWAFVDYENVNSLELIRLSDYEWIIVFCGPKDKKLKIDLSAIDEGKSPRFEIIRLVKSAKNNLDFHLALYLGRYHETVGERVEFTVVSNDTGFDGVVSHLKKLGRKCKIVNEKQSVGKKAAKKTVKKSTKKVSKKAHKKIITDDKTLSDSSSKAQNQMAVTSVKELETARKQVVEALKRTPKENLPSKESSLRRWIENIMSLDSGGAELLMTSMLRIRYFTIADDKVVYHLS